MIFAAPLTVAPQAPLFIGFSRQRYWNGLPFPPPGDLSGPGIEPGSPALQLDYLLTEPPGKSPKDIVIPILFYFGHPLGEACGTFPTRNRTRAPLQWNLGVVTTGLPGTPSSLF